MLRIEIFAWNSVCFLDPAPGVKLQTTNIKFHNMKFFPTQAQKIISQYVYLLIVRLVNLPLAASLQFLSTIHFYILPQGPKQVLKFNLHKKRKKNQKKKNQENTKPTSKTRIKIKKSPSAIKTTYLCSNNTTN